jgi:hypothetical protein
VESQNRIPTRDGKVVEADGSGHGVLLAGWPSIDVAVRLLDRLQGPRATGSGHRIFDRSTAWGTRRLLAQGRALIAELGRGLGDMVAA